MRILLTEVAGLTSRQVATQLDRSGHDVLAMVSDPLCLARFTRHVTSIPRGPKYGDDPISWCDRMLQIAEQEGVEVVFPTQEQVAVLSHQLPRLADAGLRTAVPPFSALRRVQDKISAQRTLEELDIPQPGSAVIASATDVRDWSVFPAFVKAPLATGSTGVVRVVDRSTLTEAIAHLLERSSLASEGVLVQEAVEGTFVMAQCVFDAGSLVAFHACERVQEGANGSAAVKQSLTVGSLRSDLARLGGALRWHGALSVDAIVGGGRARIIDVNPRLVEPGNALAAGTDLVGALLTVAAGGYVEAAPPSRDGARTHQLLMAVLGTAQRTGRRRPVIAELASALGHRGNYTGSREELLPLSRDCRALIPTVAASIATLVRPEYFRFFTEGAVSHYSLSPVGWSQLCGTSPLYEVTKAEI
jgi:biotin carboxylase